MFDFNPFDATAGGGPSSDMFASGNPFEGAIGTALAGPRPQSNVQTAPPPPPQGVPPPMGMPTQEEAAQAVPGQPSADGTQPPMGFPTQQEQQMPSGNAMLPSVMPSLPPPPTPAQIGQTLLSDPGSVERLEQLSQAWNDTRYDAARAGKSLEFMESDFGKMIGYTTDQLQQVMKETARKGGWNDPELAEVNKPHYLVAWQGLQTLQQRVVAGEYTANQAIKQKAEWKNLLKDTTGRQRDYLGKLAIAYAPSLSPILQSTASHEAVVSDMKKHTETMKYNETALSQADRQFMHTANMTEDHYTRTMEMTNQDNIEKSRQWNLTFERNKVQESIQTQINFENAKSGAQQQWRANNIDPNMDWIKVRGQTIGSELTSLQKQEEDLVQIMGSPAYAAATPEQKATFEKKDADLKERRTTLRKESKDLTTAADKAIVDAANNPLAKMDALSMDGHSPGTKYLGTRADGEVKYHAEWPRVTPVMVKGMPTWPEKPADQKWLSEGQFDALQVLWADPVNRENPVWAYTLASSENWAKAQLDQNKNWGGTATFEAARRLYNLSLYYASVKGTLPRLPLAPTSAGGVKGDGGPSRVTTPAPKKTKKSKVPPGG